MKVTFNGIQKLIIIDTGVTEIDVKVDLYSDWKEWVILSDNTKYPIALSAIGGDPLPGGKFLGSTFFLENGWKIRPYEGDHTLTLSGNLYSRDGSDVTVHTLGSYNVAINLSTSNLVDTISTSGSTITANEVAEAVWDRMAVSSTDTGSFGEFINMIKATVDLNFTKLVEANSKLDTATTLIQTLMKYESNRTKIDQTAKTLTVFDDDGITPLKVFNLRDFAGNSSITEVAEKVPV